MQWPGIQVIMRALKLTFCIFLAVSVVSAVFMASVGSGYQQ